MSDPCTLRILELDGGGQRGYLSLSFLIKFVQLWGINPAEIWKYFDVICGTSVGGLLALGLATGKDPNNLTSFFTDTSQLVFSTNGVRSNQATTLEKLASIGITGVPFYATNPATPYGSALLVSEVQTLFGANTMQSLLTNVIVPTYKVELKAETTDISTGTYTLCSNVNYPDFDGQDELISNVALSTSAAPFYLPSLALTNASPNTLNGRYIDGGVYQNNPASFGRTLATMLKPNATRCCVLSLGTGLGEMGFDDPTASLLSSLAVDVDPIISVSNLFALFGIASTGGQESISKALGLESTYTLNQLFNYRFQPTLDMNLDTELDNTTNAINTYYENLATQVFNDDIDAITEFLGHLTA